MESRGTAHRNILRRRSTRKLLSIRSVLNDRRAVKALLFPDRTNTAISASDMATTKKSKMLKDSDMKSVTPRASSCKSPSIQNRTCRDVYPSFRNE